MLPHVATKQEMGATSEHYRDVADRRAHYHSVLKQKYVRLARYPWLPVQPEPPEPK